MSELPLIGATFAFIVAMGLQMWFFKPFSSTKKKEVIFDFISVISSLFVATAAYKYVAQLIASM